MVENPYTHEQDNDLSRALDFESITRLMGTAITRTVDALGRDNTICSDARAIIGEQLNQFRSTHESITNLIRQSDSDHLLYGDAVSLAREQVEKIFVIALLLDEPTRWARTYQRYGFRKFYEEYLIVKYEYQDLPRFNKYLTQQSPDLLEKLRLQSEITTEEMAATKDRFENDFFDKGSRLPDNLKGHEIVFPTPGQVRSLMKRKDVANLLNRWYYQWKRLCDFAHTGHDKVALATILGRNSPVNAAKQKTYIEQKVHTGIYISIISAASACTEVARPYISTDLDLSASLINLWNKLNSHSLLDKVFWEIRAKQMFPLTQLDGPPDQNTV